MYWFNYKRLIILCTLFGLFSTVKAKKGKVLKCFECNNTGNIDCDFLDYIIFNGRWLKTCVNSTECQVARFETSGYPKIERSCKSPNATCPDGAKCCTCRKKACNGNNKCTFSAASNWRISKLYALIAIIIVIINNCYN